MRLTRAAARAALEKKTNAAERPFRILDLPPELVEQIFDHLKNSEGDALLNVRRLCRAFRDLSLKPFGTGYFEHLVVMLHPLSLTILLEIANHRRLAPFVEQVTVSGERIGGVIDMRGHEDEQTHKDLQTSVRRSAMDQIMLGEAFDMLCQLHLGNIRIDNESFRVYKSIKGLRCGSRYIFTSST